MSDNAPDSGTTLLDAPADTKGGADGNKQGSLLDTKPDANEGGKPDGTKPAGSQPDKTPPADSQPGAKPPASGTTTDSGKTTDKPAPSAPEKYAEFKTPDGLALDQASLEKFDATCKELNLPQEKRDSLLTLQAQHTESQIKKTMDAFNEQINAWTDETKKELGADPTKSLAVASKAIDSIFTDPKENKEFREMMKTTGLGNWRLMVKAFSFVGKSLSEDRFVEGRPDSKESKTPAERIYPDLAPR
jgi:hypothetical protein